MTDSIFSDVPTESRLREYRLLSALLNITGILTTWLFAWVVRDASPGLMWTCIIISSLTAIYRMTSMALSMGGTVEERIRYYERGAAASGVLTGSIGVCAFVFLGELPIELYGAYSAWAFICAATVTIAASPISKFSGMLGSLSTVPVAVVLIATEHWSIAGLHLIGSASFAALGFYLNTLFRSQEKNRKAIVVLGRRTEEAMRWFLNEASDFAFETGPDLLISFASNNVGRVLGTETDAVVGTHLLEIVEKDGREAQNDDQIFLIRKSLKERTSFNDVTIETRAAGKTFWRSYSGAPIFDSEGSFIGYRGWAADRTKIIEATRNLEAQVELRTRELIKERNRATEASKSKSIFLASMSHEIRTPLNGVIGFAEALSEQLENDDQKAMASQIHSSGETLLVLLNDLLDMSKIGAEQVTLMQEPMNVATVIDSAVETFVAKAKLKKLMLISNTASVDGISVVGDRLRVRQIVQNLVNNAVKFTDTGQVIVNVQYGMSGVTIEVSDSGIGMSEKDTDRIFDEFYQTEDGVKAQGTGLGLSIVSGLVRAMSGKITVASERGVGTTFTVTLPLQLQTKDSSSASMLPIHCVLVRRSHEYGGIIENWARKVAQTVTVVDDLSDLGEVHAGGFFIPSCGEPRPIEQVKAMTERHGMTLVTSSDSGTMTCFPTYSVFKRRLLSKVNPDKAPKAVSGETEEVLEISVLGVDDNMANRVVLETLISKSVVRFDLADSGEAALEACKSHRYDVVLMDFVMPGMSGIEASKRILQLAFPPKIFGLTADPDANLHEEAIASGMSKVVTKPIKKSELLELLRSQTDARASTIDVA